MYVSTVRLKSRGSGEACSRPTFFFAIGAEYIRVLITASAWHTPVCNLMEILNKDAAYLSGHAE